MSALKKFQGKFKGTENTLVDLEVQVLIFSEDGLHYAYCPFLDITGYGTSEKEAQESFNLMVSEFIDYTLKKNTLRSELKMLGWSIKRSKKKPMVPPPIEEVARKNENLSEILNHKSYRTERTPVGIPA